LGVKFGVEFVGLGSERAEPLSQGSGRVAASCASLACHCVTQTGGTVEGSRVGADQGGLAVWGLQQVNISEWVDNHSRLLLCMGLLLTYHSSGGVNLPVDVSVGTDCPEDDLFLR